MQCCSESDVKHEVSHKENPVEQAHLSNAQDTAPDRKKNSHRIVSE